MEEPLWIQSLDTALREMQEIPFFGSPPPFPWQEFGEMLQQTLEQPSLELFLEKASWLSNEQLIESFGENPLIQPFVLSPLPGPLFLVLSESGSMRLTAELIAKEAPTKGGVDSTIREGFLHFLFLTTCHLFNQLNPFTSLSASLGEKAPLPSEGAYALDLSLDLNQSPISIRILLPKDAHAGFKSQFAAMRPSLEITDELKTTPMPLSIEVGTTTLPAAAFEKVEVGDLLILDRCSYDLDKKKGTALLTLASTPLFDVRIKEGEVKMLEYALTHEDPSMSGDLPPEDEPLPPPPIPPEAGEEGEEEAPLWSSEENAPPPKEDLLSKKEIPLNLTVEVGRFQMPLEKLAQLQPGNVLDVQLNPELGVHLTVGGKRVAKGELVKMGEMIGVKILSLGE